MWAGPLVVGVLPTGAVIEDILCGLNISLVVTEMQRDGVNMLLEVTDMLRDDVMGMQRDGVLLDVAEMLHADNRGECLFDAG